MRIGFEDFALKLAAHLCAWSDNQVFNNFGENLKTADQQMDINLSELACPK